MMELCKVCDTRLKNKRSLKCKTCDQKVHITCNKTSPQMYKKLKDNENSEVWMCISCMENAFPFYSLDADGLPNEDKNLHKLENLNVKLNENDKKTLELINNLISQNTDPNNEENPFCKYYTTRKFCKSNFQNNKSLSIFHLNIASLHYHFDELLVLLDTLDFTFDILTFTETKLKDKVSPRQIKNNYYDIEHTPSEADKGGTIIYAAKHLFPKPRNDLNIYESKRIESTFIEIQTDKEKTCIIGCIYKHHNIEIKEFSEKLSATMKNINKENKPAYITGDFNVNLLQIEKNDEINDYYDEITNLDFLPLITLPTRITHRSKSLIDNILTNSFNNDVKTGNITVNISDHIPQFAIIPLNNKITLPKNHNLFIRDTRNLNINKLKEEINTANFEYTKNGTCLNADMQQFITEVNKIIDKHAPCRKITKKELKERTKPWITKGIRRSIKQRNKLFNKLKNECNQQDKMVIQSKIKVYRNKIKHLLRDSKKNYYKNYFKNNAINIKNLWKGINEIISNKKDVASSINCIETNDNNKKNNITDKKEIANKFNKYFTNVADKILKTRRFVGNKSYDRYLSNYNHRFKITPTNPTEIQYIIDQLNPRKGTGPFSIPSFILRKLSSAICIPLSNLCNRSFESGIFPEILKITRVIPIHKKKSKLDISNYRPISILSNIDKIFEKVMSIRVRNHFERSNLLHNLQFGFREKHSTNHAVISMVQKIQEVIKNKNIAIGVFIDLQKAFDTVNHNILLNKLDSYGIRGIAKNWIKSYLTHRQQYVSIDGFESDKEFILHGVPQGSVLGPLLFTIYINDMHTCIKSSTTFHFADDTNLLYVPQKKVRNRNIVRKLNADLKALDNWLKANKISLNSTKTELVIFRKKQTPVPDIKIKLNGIRLLPTKCVKYLGIYLDENLSFETHITLLNAKLRRANNMLAISRHYVPLKYLTQIYYGQFHSHLQYCCQIWGQKQTKLTKTITLQNKAIRLMTFSAPDTHSNPLYKKLDILKLTDVVTTNNINFVHKALNGNTPLSFKNSFKETEANKRYSTTRNPNTLCSIPVGSVEVSHQKDGTIQHQCTTDWNTMLKNLSTKTCPKNWMKNLSINKLKEITKEYFIAQYV